MRLGAGSVRAMVEMLVERSIDVPSDLTLLVLDALDVAIVFPIDDSTNLAPGSALAMQVVTHALFHQRPLMTGALELEVEPLSKPH